MRQYKRGEEHDCNRKGDKVRAWEHPCTDSEEAGVVNLLVES